MSDARPDVLVLSGRTGRDDEWHDFEATSAAVARTLREAGRDVAVRAADEAGPELIGAAKAVVVNGGLHTRLGGDRVAQREAAEALAESPAVLALHITALAWHDEPAWVERLGVRWIEGTSMHPPIGPVALTAYPDHPIGAGLGTVHTYDELYTNLVIGRPGAVVLSHRWNGVDQPLSMAREDPDGRRTVYDALGHGVESYASPSRRAMLLRELDWLRASP